MVLYSLLEEQVSSAIVILVEKDDCVDNSILIYVLMRVV